MPRNSYPLSILGVAVFIFCFALLFQQTQYIFLFFAITGAIFAGGIILQQLDPNFPVNGQEAWAIAMGASSIVYVLVSLLGPQPREKAVFDRLLHRGAYAVAGDHVRGREPVSRGLKLLFFTEEFSRGDKILYLATYVWVVSWFVVFLVGTIANLSGNVGNDQWIRFWKVYLLVMFAAAIVVFFWFTTGGVRDLGKMVRRLRTQSRDRQDDGIVRHGPVN